MKWCDYYNVWLSELEDIIEEPDCDMFCEICEDCKEIE